MFIGLYTHQMDDKGRIRIPPAFRKQLGEKPMMFRALEGCMFIFTREDFDKQIETIKNSSFLDMDMNDVKRAIFSGSQEVAEDKQGRVSLNSYFIDKCGFKKDLVCVGAGDHVELWDAATYEERSNSVDFTKIIARFTGARVGE